MRGCFSGNFESRSLNSVSFEQGMKRAESIIQKEAVPFEKFEPIFGADVVRADKAHVANLKERFKKGKQIDAYGSNCGTIFEAILHMRLKKGDWISNVDAIKPNEFDDFTHGMDEVVRVINPETKKQETVFAIDALTVGGGPLNVGVVKKMDRIKEEVVSNHLPEIKYFLNEETGEVGIKNIPRIVVAADTKTMQGLNELWMERNGEELAKHPLQIQILEQIIEQAVAIGSFAKRNGQNEIAEKYDAIRMWAKKKLNESSKRARTDWNDDASSVVSNALWPFKEIKV